MCKSISELTRIVKVAERQGWYKRNVRLNAPFPFLPFDRTNAPSENFANWEGPWAQARKVAIIRSSAFKFFGSHGTVEAYVCSFLCSTTYENATK
jgi:hypothetical protein